VAHSVWREWLRVEDFVWLALFSALHYFSPVKNDGEIELLVAFAVFHLLSPRLPFFATAKGNLVAIAIKLLLGWLLIGVTFGVESSYFLILLVPVVSAATSLGIGATLAFTLLSCGAYLSWLLFVDWSRAVLAPRDISEIALRVLFLLMAGYLTHELATRNRTEARKYQTAAEQLAQANVSLGKAEAAMRRSERLAALGQLTAGLAHELRNPLGTMKNSAELLARRLADSDAIAVELAGYISSEVDRANSLITKFLQFARPFELQPAPVDLTAVIDKAIAQLERRNPPFDVTFVRNYSPGLPPAALDAELMEQVFVNLLSNAAQASPPGSVVTVKTRGDGALLEAAVIDRGSGIDPKFREQIFNPFFTTKKDGVGLGLAIVSKIVDEHGGRIAVESEPGQGSIFRVLIPLEIPPKLA
jgi:signal transduction histidine kinase